MGANRQSLIRSVTAAAGLAAALLAVAAEVPPLTARVSDLTATLSAEQTAHLEALLAQHEARTGNQIAVLLLPGTDGEPIESYAVRVFEQWQLGQAGKDNGLLFVVARNDRKMRIEVGYGLEDEIPDVIAARIIREVVAPHFKVSDYYEGIEAGLTSLMQHAAGEAPDWQEGESGVEPEYAGDGSNVATPEETRIILVWPSLVILTFILIFVGMSLGNRAGNFFTSLGLASFFGTFIAVGMCVLALNGTWKEMQWWWQYLPAIALGTLFTWLGVGRAMGMGNSGGSSATGSWSSSSRSSGSRSSSSSFSGGGGRSGGGGASGGW